MTTEDIASLVPWKPNPRRGKVSAIAESLKTNGQYKPVIVQASTRKILAGNHVVKAALRLGWTTVQCAIVDVDDEDTDLSLVMLKNGWATVQFNAFLQFKMNTQKLAGGNTDAFYASEGTLPKSLMLARTHPDVARVVWRFHRWHHHVDYSPFKSMGLIRRPDYDEIVAAESYPLVTKRAKRSTKVRTW